MYMHMYMYMYKTVHVHVHYITGTCTLFNNVLFTCTYCMLTRIVYVHVHVCCIHYFACSINVIFSQYLHTIPEHH